MIKSIKIDNFKSIETSSMIEIAPITLILGPNSSGKSSILKPLLLMKQTVDSRDVQKSVQVDGAYVKLGPFREFVFNHGNNKEVKFTLSYAPESGTSWRTTKKERILQSKYQGRAVLIPRQILELKPDNIEIEVSFVAGAYEQTINRKTKYTISDKSLGTLIIDKMRGLKGTYSGFAKTDDETFKFSAQKKSKFYDIMQSIAVRYVSLSKSELGYNLPRLLSYITRSFELVISRIFYLGPLREEPAPLYGASSERPQDVGKAGEDAPTVLWIGRGEKRQIELRRKVEKWMAKFEIAQKLGLHKLGPFFQVLLTDWHTGIKCNLTDVGFGASQLLPIIVAGYFMPEQSLLIAEQPEIHLHPKAQTRLGDLLIDISKEDKILLVETHSEHLIMRIQRRIADGTISNDKVALYYCEPSKQGTLVKRINIDEYGQLQPDLPAGFFDEGYLESQKHLEAMIAKKSRENQSKGSM